MYDAIKGRRHYLPEKRVKYYMYQLMKSIDHMHRNGIFHRDIKPENILLIEDQVKLADFGSCRGIYSKQPYTEYISTRWYRAPECLLTDGYYGYKMDLWGVGCVMFEVLSLFPLFPGNDELDQIQKIHQILGSPDDALIDKFERHASHMDFKEIRMRRVEGQGIAKLIPQASAEVVDLIEKLLIYNADNRITASQALKHPWFREIREQETILRQQYAVTQQSAGVRASNFPDSLSLYRKQSNELDAVSDLGDKQSKISHLYSSKKQPVKAHKKLPDLQLGYYQEGSLSTKGQNNMGNSSDSDGDQPKQLPLIKGGASKQHMNNSFYNNQSQISDTTYSMKADIGGKKKNISTFNNSKYMAHSPSPSQTFFKGKSSFVATLAKKILTVLNFSLRIK